MKSMIHKILLTALIPFVLFFYTGCRQDISLNTKIEEVIVPERVVVEYIVQPTRPESLDVLAILDTSCSMSDNYDELSVGLEILKGDILNLTDDFNISFINSSLEGEFFIGPFDESSDAIDLLLAPYVLTSDAYEVAFQSLYQFTSTPEASYALRPNADKLYIFVSDENEQSPLPVDIFKDWLDSYNHKVQHDVVTISTTEGSECAGYGSTVGARYNELSNYYGKQYIDICSDWSDALANSSFLVNLKNYINLDFSPVEDSIIVAVDGEETELWYYLNSTNTIYFDFEITEGSLITVGYNTTQN